MSQTEQGYYRRLSYTHTQAIAPNGPFLSDHWSDKVWEVVVVMG